MQQTFQNRVQSLYMKNLSWKLLIGALFIASTFEILFYKTSTPGINVVLFEIVIIGTVTLLARHTKHKIPTYGFVAAGFALAFATTFAIWTSALGITLSIAGLIFANFFFALAILGHSGTFNHPINLIFESVKHAFQTLFKRLGIFRTFHAPDFSDESSGVLRGLMFAVPVVLIFAALFFASDLILQKRATGLTDWVQTYFGVSDIFAHVFFIGILTLLLLLFFSAAFWRRLEMKELASITSKFNTESTVILALSTLLFLAFIIFQSFYLFGGQAAWESIEGLTYSEYAVKGFNELATISVLVLGLILSLRFLHAEQARNKAVPILETVLLLETVFIIISAWIRLQLYVAEYDFTPARLFGFWFFILTTILLILLALNILLKKPQYKYLHQSLVIIGVMMLAFTASAPDALSVKLNIRRMTNENPLDPFPHFNALSAEAYPVMHEALTNDDYEIGRLETTITDYCSLIEAYYEDHDQNRDTPQIINSFSYKNTNKDNKINDALWEDFQVRRDIASFEKKWNNRQFEYNRHKVTDDDPRYIVKKLDWRAWNLAQMKLPNAQEYDETNVRYSIPFKTGTLANACGMYKGDPIR